MLLITSIMIKSPHKLIYTDYLFTKKIHIEKTNFNVYLTGDISRGLDRRDVLCTGCSLILELDLLCVSHCGGCHGHYLVRYPAISSRLDLSS